MLNIEFKVSDEYIPQIKELISFITSSDKGYFNQEEKSYFPEDKILMSDVCKELQVIPYKIEYLHTNKNYEVFKKELFKSYSNMIKDYGSREENKLILIDNNGCTIFITPKIRIYKKDEYNICFFPHLKGIELYRLEIINTGQGLGSKFMEEFVKISKTTKIPIYLKLGIPGAIKDDNPKTREKRRNFYHKFNFKRESDSLYWSNKDDIKE